MVLWYYFHTAIYIALTKITRKYRNIVDIYTTTSKLQYPSSVCDNILDLSIPVICLL